MLNWLLRSRIRCLRLQPGDIVLMRTRGILEPELAASQSAALKQFLPDGVVALIMDDKTTVEVLRAA